MLWPLLLVLLGFNIITRRRDIPGIVIGALLLGVGVVFLGNNTGLFYVNATYFWQGFWPVIIILIGINLLTKNRQNSAGNLAFMGSVEKTHQDWNLTNTEYTAIMGGIELDIRKASFDQREVSLVLTTIMGGITIIVPEDVAITCKGTAILGGIDLMGKGTGGIIGNTNAEMGDLQNAAKIIHLDCTCIMGGIEIKR